MNANMNKLALVIGAMVMASGAWAALPGQMDVTASISSGCQVSAGSALTFGALTMFNGSGDRSVSDSNSTGGGAFSAICTNGTVAPKLAFTSANAGATSTFRLVGADTPSHIVYTLKDGATDIGYNFAAAFTGFAGDGTSHPLTITGAIAADQKDGKLVQAYSDLITITSSYTP